MIFVQYIFHSEYNYVVIPEYGRPSKLGWRVVAIVPSCDWSGKHLLQMSDKGVRDPQECGRNCDRNLQCVGRVIREIPLTFQPQTSVQVVKLEKYRRVYMGPYGNQLGQQSGIWVSFCEISLDCDRSSQTIR